MTTWFVQQSASASFERFVREELELEFVESGPVVRCNVHLRVTDTGEGIAPDDVPNVFEQLYRSDSARHRTGNGGSGLGLAICKALVEAQGGQILVEKTVPGTKWPNQPFQGMAAI